MAACAGFTGIPRPVLKNAKRLGCHAFDQAGRVHLAPLLAWLFSDDNAGTSTDWHARWKRAQAIGLEQRLARERGDLIDGELWVQYVHGAVGACKTVIFDQIQMAPMELAAAGDDVAKNREALRVVLWDKFWPAFFAHTITAAEKFTVDHKAAVDAITNPTTKMKTPKKTKSKKRETPAQQFTRLKAANDRAEARRPDPRKTITADRAWAEAFPAKKKGQVK